MPKFSELLETEELFLFETYVKYLVALYWITCPLTFNFSKQKVFQCSTLWLIRAKISLNLILIVWLFCKDLGLNLEFLQNSYNYFENKIFLLTVKLFTYTEGVHIPLIMVSNWVSYNIINDFFSALWTLKTLFGVLVAKFTKCGCIDLDF